MCINPNLLSSRETKAEFKGKGTKCWYMRQEWIILSQTKTQTQLKNIRTGKTKYISNKIILD
jgi:hypothetical protein